MEPGIELQELKKRNQEILLNDLKEKNRVVSFLPKDMDIEITSYCNYRCAMCPHALAGNAQARHLDSSVWEKLKPLFPYCKRVMLQGDGEPLLYPYFKEAVEELAGCGLQICMTTNLSLLTEDLAKFLAKHFSLLTVSCDGGSKEVYESIRQGGNFARFAENLRMLMNYMDPEKVMANAVVMRQNLLELVPLLKFLKGCGVRRVMFSSLLTTEYLKNGADNPMHYPQITARALDEAKAYADKNGLFLVINWDYKGNGEKEKGKVMPGGDREKEKGKVMPGGDNEKQKGKEAPGKGGKQVMEGKAFGGMRETDGADRERRIFQEAGLAAEKRTYSKGERQRFLEAYQELHQVQRVRKVPAGQYHCEGICKNIFEKIYIDVRGNLTLCCFGKTKGVGNLLEDSLEEIWNGEVYSRCRQAFFAGELPDFCIGCRYAMASSCQAVQAYPFYVADLDEAFFDDRVFWENR